MPRYAANSEDPLGRARPTNIRQWIEEAENKEELEMHGGLHAVRANSSEEGGPPALDYWWTFEQAMVYVCKARGKKSLALRISGHRVP